MMKETGLWNFYFSSEMLHYCVFLLYQLRIKPIQYYLCKCWDTQSLVSFSDQSVGPEMKCEHVLSMFSAQWLFSLSELHIGMHKYPVFSWDGMRTNAKIFLSQIEFLFSYQLITCIRCLMSFCCLKNRYNTGKYVWTSQMVWFLSSWKE